MTDTPSGSDSAFSFQCILGEGDVPKTDGNATGSKSQTMSANQPKLVSVCLSSSNFDY
jgi:hypothetical protein